MNEKLCYDNKISYFYHVYWYKYCCCIVIDVNSKKSKNGIKTILILLTSAVPNDRSKIYGLITTNIHVKTAIVVVFKDACERRYFYCDDKFVKSTLQHTNKYQRTWNKLIIFHVLFTMYRRRRVFADFEIKNRSIKAGHNRMYQTHTQFIKKHWFYETAQGLIQTLNTS